MKANELSIGWAMQQSDPAAAVQQVIERSTQWVACQSKNVRLYGLRAKERASEWLARESETFNALAATEGDRYTRMDVVKAHAALALVIILIGIGGAL